MAADAREAREIHRRLWNQGVNPFLIVLLPGEVRVYAGFKFHPGDVGAGLLKTVKLSTGRVPDIASLLAVYHADAINRGELWVTQQKHLRPEGRVDATLLAGLQSLSVVLQHRHKVSRPSSHALIGRFVYLHYLRARRILTPEWMASEASVAEADVFSPDATLAAFRRLSKAVEKTFNGKIFPIPWGAKNPPRAEAVKEVARVFAGEDPSSGQLPLPFTAYDFSHIPIELLSSIYEQFLHAEDPDASSQDGAHYTPEPLAEYVVSEVQSVLPMREKMRILDPCCGSGVFLVVAFRRLVERECSRRGLRLLPAQDVKRLLTESIFAVERNKTACGIAAFSLVLTMLTYIDPPELHRLKRSFKFPSLIGKNLFPEDFFAPDGSFWAKSDPETKEPLRFDWIIGNPPWVELNPKTDEAKKKAKPIRDWIAAHRAECAFARDRTGEAFAWRVRDALKPDGVAGLVLAAKTLTNDQLKGWRAKFFASHRVHRVTNFANLAYVIFPGVDEGAMTLTYGLPGAGKLPSILHVGPFVANQVAISRVKKAWVVGVTESELKSVAASDAASGNAATWKIALWGNHRDVRELARLKSLWPTTLKELANSRGWCLALGLQLKKDAGRVWTDKKGRKREENAHVKELEGLPLLKHRALVGSGPHLEFTSDYLGKNTKGCYARGGRTKGVGLVSAPHVFLWNDWAAFNNDKCIIEHSKVAVAGKSDKDEDALRAVSLIWTSSITQFAMVLELSSDWGFGRSLIDLGDAESVRLPELTDAVATNLADLHRQFAAEVRAGAAFDDAFRRRLDRAVADATGLPASVMDTATDFALNRMDFNKGVVPPSAKLPPIEADLRAYAARLAGELDAFVARKARHRITILHSSAGVCASVEITRARASIEPVIRDATGADSATLRKLLAAAEQQFSQWVYVKRSVRIMDDATETLHLIKPPRRCEWTEGRALLDAGDVIAEIATRRK